MDTRNNKNKQVLMNLNISHSKFGHYKNCLTGQAMKSTVNNGFDVGTINNICNVLVINQHGLDVISEFCQRGFNSGYKDGINPAMMCVVSKEFYGSNLATSEGIRDEVINLRTNFNCTMSNHNPYPIKDNECVYNRFLTVIRNHQFIALTLQQIYRFGLLTVTPIFKPELLDVNRMSIKDFVKTMTTIECMFQTAIRGGHNLLMLAPFGHTDDEIPQEDVVTIFNSCIFKYGHHFKYIIFAIPVSDGKEIFDLYHKNIIKPQELTKEIDEIYTQRELEQITSKNKKQQSDAAPDNMLQMNPLMMQLFLKQMQMANTTTNANSKY